MDFEQSVKELLELAKKNDGWVKTEDVLKYCDADSEEFDKLEKEIINAGYEIIPSFDLAQEEDMPADFALEDVEPIDVEKFDVLPPSIKVDDPVRMYLKDIGKIPLIDANTETVLAKQVVAGNQAQRILDSGKIDGHDVDDLIKKVEEETLSSYPISIQKESIDMC